MLYFSSYAILASFVAGALTTVIFFHKRIFSGDFSFDSDQKTSRDLEVKFYNLLSSTLDLNLYKNSINAIELERQRIGTDVHDELASHLSSLTFDLELIEYESSALSDRANEVLVNMRNKVKNTVVLLRNIIHGILPPSLRNENVTEAIRELCNKHEGEKGTSILFRTFGQPVTLTQQQNLYLYRIMQELLTNCFKHSLAWTIFVTVTWNNNELIISVKDTGIGMPKFVEKANKFGISGIFVRSAIIGAKAKFKTPTTGAEFELRLPFENRNIEDT